MLVVYAGCLCWLSMLVVMLVVYAVYGVSVGFSTKNTSIFYYTVKIMELLV